MAYSLGDRFPRNPPCQRLVDPAAYMSNKSRYIKSNKVGFLSRAPRNTFTGLKSWTSAVYETSVPSNIVNCTAFLSKSKRFPYEALSKEDLEEILCRCGLPCECPIEEEPEEDLNCQAKVRRRLFKGAPPHSLLGEGISAPSKRHRGYEIFPNGAIKQMLDEAIEECPPFYDARVNEATAFYQGWKWSKWKSQRTPKSLEVRPGPADYTIQKIPTEFEICAEKFRAERRKHSKQLRYIEIIQNRNILEGRPGPADYDPKEPKGTDVPLLGPKAERFSTAQYEMRPGPAEYSLKSAFDPPEIPEFPCHAKLPDTGGFGVKAPRFRSPRVEGPGPASYSPSNKLCRFLHCQAAPFNCSAARFKDTVIEEDDDVDEDDIIPEEESEPTIVCPELTWEFKSKTMRIKPLVTKFDEPSPADIVLSKAAVDRPLQLQYLAPFNSSEGRFQPWYDWLPVQGQSGTPGPCYYSLERPKCPPAVCHGPIYRSARFRENQFQTPAPNEYNVGGGVETVLATHNKRLKKNIKNKHKFHWDPPADPRKLTFAEQEMALFNKTIDLLEDPEGELNAIMTPKPAVPAKSENALPETANDFLKSEKKERSAMPQDIPQGPTIGSRESAVHRHSAAGPRQSGIVPKESASVNRQSASAPPEVATIHVEIARSRTEPAKEKLLRSFLYRYPMPHYY